MQVAHLQELAHLEDGYWWHVAKRELVTELLLRHAPPPGRLIEGGVGACRNLLAFQELGYDVTGYDIMPEAVELGRQRGLDDVRQHDLGCPWPSDRRDARAIILLDVVEHVPDPVRVLGNARDALADDGVLIVTVPAYQFLYGDWDRALGHFRRYTAAMLRRHAVEAGLQVRQLTHWNSFTLPAAIAVRGLQRMRPSRRAAEFPRVSEGTNRLLQRCAAAERWMLHRCGVPCGLSVVGVLTR
ncbi:MAG: class I SAM-dependent methyltransferase [Planctomyces sp.]|nr:class I SAM-dependent methyltransferase [Planctomyces sp.]